MTRNGPIALAFHALFLGFMVIPAGVVVAIAFTPETALAWPAHGLSLRWFRAILDHPEFIASLWFSLLLGVAAATLATIVAVPAALAIGRWRFAGRGAILAVVLSPLMVPAVILGAGLLLLLSMFGLRGTITGLVLAHAVVVVPFVLRMVLTGVVGLDGNLDRAAASLGAGGWLTFRLVRLPLLLPGIAGGWVLGFMTSFDEITVSLFVSGPQTTPLPVRLFSRIVEMPDPLVAAVAVVMMGISGVLLLILDRIYGVDRLLSAAPR